MNSEYRQLGSCQIQSGPRRGENAKAYPQTYHLFVICYNQMSAANRFPYIYQESGNERVTSPPQPACSFSLLTCNCPALRALGLCKLQQFQMERQPHKMTSGSPRRKNNNKFIHMDALKWILTWVSSREKRTQ